MCSRASALGRTRRTERASYPTLRLPRIEATVKAGAADQCNERGGSVNSNQEDLACAATDLAARNDSNDHLGIRCCAP
jgi:hypothetical protein